VARPAQMESIVAAASSTHDAGFERRMGMKRLTTGIT
jgi:hypothetical protein